MTMGFCPDHKRAALYMTAAIKSMHITSAHYVNFDFTCRGFLIILIETSCQNFLWLLCLFWRLYRWLEPIVRDCCDARETSRLCWE